MAATGTDLGVDLLWITDLDPTHRLTSGTALVGQAIYHRLITPHGGLIGDPDYGLGLLGMLHEALTPVQRGALVGQIRSECLKDERLAAVVVTLEPDTNDPRTFKVSIRGETADGPFRLIVTADLTLGAIASVILDTNG